MRPDAIRTRTVLTLLAAASLAAGCAGEIAPPAEPGATISPDEGAPQPASGGGLRSTAPGAATPSAPGAEPAAGPGPAGTPPRPTAAACKTAEPGPTPLRRLSRLEYDNTVRDLLGDTTQPARDFPAEERPLGFDNAAEGRSVSPFLAEQYFLAAERLAGAYVDRVGGMLPSTYGCADLATAAGEERCAESVIVTLGKRAFRRPVPPEDRQLLLDGYRAGKAAGGFKAGLKVVVASLLQSPRFLYRVELGVAPAPGEAVVRLDGWEVAARLSYLLWGTMPDAALLAAAEAGKLATPAVVAAEVTRMLGDRKARAQVARFHDQWLEIERIEALQKDSKVYPRFTSGIARLMTDETRRFLDHAFWEGAGDLRGLLTGGFTFADATLARFYGLAPPSATGFQRIELDGERRAGLLGQGGLMAMLANPNQSSPVRRGQFVREQLLCQPLPPPPDSAEIELPALDAKLTTRERFARHATDPGCAGCHGLMDPIGLGFENFDGIGLWRDAENGKAIDPSGEVRGVSFDGRFAGAVDLGRKLAASPEAGDCTVRSWFRFAHGRAELPGVDDCNLDVVRKRFAGGGHKLRDLLVALTETDAFLYRRIAGEGGPP